MMTREDYLGWLDRLPRCLLKRRVCWPSRQIAEDALVHLVETAVSQGRLVTDPGAYPCDEDSGCGQFHLTRSLSGMGRPRASERQRRNQPATHREKRRRQRAAYQARKKQSKRQDD